MRITRNQVIAILGGAVVLFAVGGLMEVQSRAGPFEETLRPAEIPLSASGTLERTASSGTAGPSGICLPEPPATQCTPARLSLDLAVDGLPNLGSPARYTVWLVDDEDHHPVGPLAPTDGTHRIAVDEPLDATAYTGLVVTAESAAGAAGGPTILAYDLAPGAGTEDLTRDAPATVSQVQGEVVLREIGGIVISSTADLTLGGLVHHPGWTYQAWLRDDGATPTYTDLGRFQPGADGRATFDARIERLPLEDQDAFVVTLEPGRATSATPSGLPVAVALLD